MLDAIPDDRAYCPLCSCPRCANVILGYYKGIRYKESLEPRIPQKITDLSELEIGLLKEIFYDKYPALKRARDNCN